jgi:hypothetical protein
MARHATRVRDIYFRKSDSFAGANREIINISDADSILFTGESKLPLPGSVNSQCTKYPLVRKTVPFTRT